MANADSRLPPELPPQVTRMLGEFIEAAKGALGSDLHSIVLFGSAAEGRLRATSDVNVIVLLARFDPRAAEALREPLRVAQAAIRLSPMFILEAELPSATTAFAEKFADILRRRKILYGTDPFAGVTIPRDIVAARLDQVLLNLILRLREAYLMRGLREEQLALAVAETAGPLRSAAANLLELQGQPITSPKAALDKFLEDAAIRSWSEAHKHVSEAREQSLLPPGVAGPCLMTLIEIAQSMRSQLSKLGG